MKITIRGKEYIAENLTDLNYLPLGSLFIDKSGNSLVAGMVDFESLSPQTKFKLIEPLYTRLSKPSELEPLARSLSAIFPSLPCELVSYSRDGFTLNLGLTELLSLAVAVGNELQALQTSAIADDTHIKSLNPSDDELARAEALARSESVINLNAKIARSTGRMAEVKLSLKELDPIEDLALITELTSEYHTLDLELKSYKVIPSGVGFSK